jgi:Uma2 family endonuclease
MATSVLIPIAEYLSTNYRPDREYIDGEVLERNMGKWEHSRIQILLGAWFVQHESVWKIQSATEWRTRVSPSRIRIPDLVLVPLGPQSEILTIPPILAVEILSPDDTYSETENRARDYQQMGVQTIWIIDPQTRTGRVCTGAAWTQTPRLEVPGTEIHVDLPSLFALLDSGPQPA